MATLLLKKRQISGFCDGELEVPKPKFRVEDGKTQRNKASYLANLAKMFPQVTREDIEQEFEAAREDPMLTVERIRAKIEVAEKLKGVTLNVVQPPEPHPTGMPARILETIELLKGCASQNAAYEILGRLVHSIEEGEAQRRERLEAENNIFKKVFKVQKKLLLEEQTRNGQLEEELTKCRGALQLLWLKLKDSDLASQRRDLEDNRDVF